MYGRSIHKYTSTTTDQQPVSLNNVNNHNFLPEFDIVIMLVNQRRSYTKLNDSSIRILSIQLAAILITLSNDVNLNQSQTTTDTLYPRGSCDQPVTWEDRGIIHCTRYLLPMVPRTLPIYEIQPLLGSIMQTTQQLLGVAIVCNAPNYSTFCLSMKISTTNQYSIMSETSFTAQCHQIS